MAQLTSSEKIAKLRKERDEIMGVKSGGEAVDSDRLRNIQMSQEGDTLLIRVDLSSPKLEKYTPKKGPRRGQLTAILKHCDCTEYGHGLDLGDKILKLTLIDKQLSE